ncbi:hypothetical protein LTR97_009480 [Elasticomyces elasticus]|uniref:t-SNARE coiled-coil homology domain-containing protein n=1 Tax=Elasticomyces elasticus TaxID=574655 RepID=A0AAN7W268_9PEZI|nr:hypothetical protein LTR97_009480 [Elasticomyces elasticus]
MPPKAANGKQPAKAAQIAGAKRKSSGSGAAPAPPASDGTARRLTAAEQWVETTQPSLNDRLAIARIEAVGSERANKRVKLNEDGALAQSGPSNSFSAAMDLDKLKDYAKLNQTSLQGITERFDRLRQQVQTLQGSATTVHRLEQTVQGSCDVACRNEQTLRDSAETVMRVEQVMEGISDQQDTDSERMTAMDRNLIKVRETVNEIFAPIYGIRASTFNTEKTATDLETTVTKTNETAWATYTWTKQTDEKMDEVVEKIDELVEKYDLDGFEDMCETVDSINETVGGIEDTVGGIDDAIGTLDESVRDMEERVEAMETRVNAVDMKVDGIKAAIEKADRLATTRFNYLAATLQSLVKLPEADAPVKAGASTRRSQG